MTTINSINTNTNLYPKTSTYAGDPNGNVAGSVGDFCINTSDSNALFMCTTAGASGAAVWTEQGGGGSGLTQPQVMAINSVGV